MTRRALDETLSFVAAVDRAVSPDRIAQILLSAVRPFGYSQSSPGSSPPRGCPASSRPPTSCCKAGRNSGAAATSSKATCSTTRQFVRLPARSSPSCGPTFVDRDEAPARRIMGEAAEFGLRSGFTVPMVTLDGQYAGLSIAGDCAELPPLQRGVVQFMATYAFARSLLLREFVRPTLSLTVRETDVLQWIAEGKTDWEIAQILNVSEHLVDKMARQIRLKCGAVNRRPGGRLCDPHRHYPLGCQGTGTRTTPRPCPMEHPIRQFPWGGRNDPRGDRREYCVLP